MRVLHVIASVDPREGGPAGVVKQFSRSLPQYGHTYELATCDDPKADYVTEFPAKVHALGPTKLPFSFTPNLKRWLRVNIDNYDAVIMSGIWDYPCVAASSVCRKRGKKYWVFTHGMLDPWFNKAYPLKRIKKMLYWPWLYTALKGATAVLFTAEEERILARKSFWPYKVRERVVSYGTGRPPNDAENQLEAFFTRFPQLDGARYLLFLSRIHPKKGCDLLLKAFDVVSQEDRDLYLVMAGPVGQDYQAALNKIELSAHASKRVVWTGMLTGAEKYGAFRGSEAFILPSHQENFGIAVAESLSCGKPVLISNRINIWREIEAAGAGIVAEDDLEGTLALIRKWNALSPDQRLAMSEKGLVCYERNFTVERAAADLNQVIQQLDADCV